jgi:hypothetical protein
MTDYFSQMLEAERSRAARRKCFISYYGADSREVERFLADFGDAFIPKILGVSDGDDLIDSDDADYIMARIREKYLGDSTVTICLLGSCTHSRRYIDWEIKSSLRQGSYTPNALLGLLLPSQGSSVHLPQRLRDNWNEKNEAEGYALYRAYPKSVDELKMWIETAYARRETHAKLIVNSKAMFKYNHACEVHNVCH